jgi:hypothetical protein
VARALDHRGELGRTDHQHPRGTEPLADDVADDLERRQRVLGDGDAEPVQAREDVVAGRARVVGEEGDLAPGGDETLQRLARAGIERVPVPDAAVQVEDEAANAIEQAGSLSRWTSA